MIMYMVVGIMTIDLYLHGVFSLKEKRAIVKSVLGRLKSRFNIAAAEVEALDIKQKAVIGISAVSNESAHISKILDSVLDFIRGDARVALGPASREIFSYDQE